MKRIMGIDYGDARTGIAVSDLLCSIVGSTTVIHSHNKDKTVAQILELIKTHDVGELVVGLPKNMDGCRPTITTARSVRIPWMRWPLP